MSDTNKKATKSKNPKKISKTSAKTTTAKTVKGPRSEAKIAAAVAKKWEEVKEQADTEQMVDYNVNGQYAVNTTIHHPKFGMGIVIESSHQKIEVQFEAGAKSLVQNRNA